MTNLKVLQYELDFDQESRTSIALERVYGIGCERWAIRVDGGLCLSKQPDDTGYFHFTREPIPSSRDDIFYMWHRWDSANSAIEFYQRNREKILAFAVERRAWFKKWATPE